MAEAGLTRRRLLKTAAFTTGALALPFAHGAHAAGRLSAFFWDHPVPSVPPAMRKLCENWAAREKVDLQLDFVSTNGDKILLTLAAEGQAGAGHDVVTIPGARAEFRPDDPSGADARGRKPQGMQASSAGGNGRPQRSC